MHRKKLELEDCQNSYLHSSVVTVRSRVIPANRSWSSCTCSQGAGKVILLARSGARSGHGLRHCRGRALNSAETIAEISNLI